MRANLHLIAMGELTQRLATESKLTTSLPFLEMLRDQGRACTRDWLAAHHQDVGRRSTVNIGELF
ncbi:hypothetical protein D3C71_2109680 [compost metagenome]